MHRRRVNEEENLMPSKRTHVQLRLGLFIILVLVASVAAINSALALNARQDASPTDIFPLLSRTATAADSLGNAGPDLRNRQRQLPFELALTQARLAWSGTGYAGEARRVFLVPSTDRKWACVSLVGDLYRGGASCGQAADMFRETPYQLSIQSDGGPDRASRIELVGVVSAEVAEIVVADTRGVSHAVTPANGTFYYAPSRSDLAQGVGLAAVSFFDGSGRELASRKLPPF
jgi:hypothetical protein